MIITDAFWREMFLCVATTASAFFAYLSSRSGRQNKSMLRKVHDRVNGQADERVALAYEAGQRRKPQILIIDDDANDLLLSRIVLEPFGCDVSEASSIEAADALLVSRIGAARGLPFDFVLLDMRMNGRNPSDFIRLFEQKAPRIPIVMITAYPELIRESDAFKMPRIWVTKPLTTEHVRRLLEQFSIPYYKKPQNTVEI